MLPRDNAHPAATVTRRRLLAAFGLLLVAVPPMVALWTLAALWLGPPAAWVAVVVAADASVLLGLLRVPSGRTRVLLALGFLAVCAAATAWFVAAGIVGQAFGLMPWESAPRLGPVLFGMVAEPWLGAATLAWLTASAALTLWWNR